MFGYYLEVRNTFKDKVPHDWVRKQTLAQAERYITQELKQYEEKILGAEDKILALEAKLFADLVAANLMIFAMLFNGGMIPTFLLVKSYGLLNTVWALVLPGAVPIFNVILVMNFFAAVPKELEEAAFIDGANPLQVLTKIFIPISKPVLATVSLFSIVGSWNDFYSGLIYMSKATYYPLMTYIQSLQINVEDLIKQGNLSAVVDSASLGNTNLNAAKIVIAVIPLLLIYPLLQRYFVSGIVVGSVKCSV